MLRLRKLVRALPALVAALRSSGSSALLSTSKDVLLDERHQAMEQAISHTINDDAVGGFGKGPLAARNARLFAVKSEHRKLLEVARATYLENVQDLGSFVNGLKEHFELSSLALYYTNTGYMLQANREVFNENEVQKVYLLIERLSLEQEFDRQSPMPRVWMNVVRLFFIQSNENKLI